MPRAVFKTLEFIARRFSWKTGGRTVAPILAAWSCLSACALKPTVQTISVRTLEEAPALRPKMIRRAIISAENRLTFSSCPLGARLGLIQVWTPEQWEQLRAAAPEIGACPDLSDGMVVGLLSYAGLPVNGTWPIRLQGMRVHRGAGFAIGEFEGGTYLPDGTTYLEIAQFSDLRNVLMVEIDGTRFYPGDYGK